MREPAFWRNESAATRLLTPAALLYGAIAAWRMHQAGTRATCPVICIGNLTVGGAGKTPTAIAVAQILASAGLRPVFLSRGYGGRLRGPVEVTQSHSAAEIGDEPLLLAQNAPTVVARDRVTGARLASRLGDVIVMDDGFQNPALAKDLSIVAVDGETGIGNRRVFPAGPLRAPLDAQLERTGALLVMGQHTPEASGVVMAATRRAIPVLHGRLIPQPAAVEALRGTKVLAFAGIGRPEKFFGTLAAAGIPVAATRSFPDHHRYSASDADGLLSEAARAGLSLVTTEKDAARLRGDPGMARLAATTKTLPVTMEFAEPEARGLVLGAAGRATSRGPDRVA